MTAATWLRFLWAHRNQSIHGGQASRLVKGPEKRQVPWPVFADPPRRITALPFYELHPDAQVSPIENRTSYSGTSCLSSSTLNRKKTQRSRDCHAT
jgi:hypothetical protein